MPEGAVEQAEEDHPAVSIIICARNEAENLQQYLPRILNQNYHSFEVIVINDHSDDKTEDILLDFNINYPILRFFSLQRTDRNSPGKKQALAKGIDTAKHEVLLFTDADCCPASPYWLDEMQKAIRGDVAIGLGFAPYQSSPGFLNRFIRFETVFTAVQYLSFALAGMPYMGVGRNLIYRKQLYQQGGGFDAHAHIASGDDDLFVNAAATKKNTSIIIKDAAFVYSPAKESWYQYYRQKTRHYTTGKIYKLHHQILLGLLALTHFIHYFGGLVLLMYSSTMFVAIILILVRILIVLFYYRFILKKLCTPDLFFWIPVLDAALALHYLIFLPALFTGNTNKWT